MIILRESVPIHTTSPANDNGSEEIPFTNSIAATLVSTKSKVVICFKEVAEAVVD